MTVHFSAYAPQISPNDAPMPLMVSTTLDIAGLVCRRACSAIADNDNMRIPAFTHAMSELGELASGAVSGDRLTPAKKQNMIASVNAGIRMLSLSAMALHARLQTNPAMSSVVDTMSGIGASFGLI